MFRLLEMGVLPIVNENDSISTSEIEEPSSDRGAIFGDNDQLSALVASKLDADLLLLLTDVDGLYPRNPSTGGETGGTPLSIVGEITDEITSMADGNGDGPGRGGMASKLRSITIALQSGIPAVIANGLKPEGIKSRKHWIAYASSTAGSAAVNPGAKKALVEQGSSLLFKGAVRIDGDFRRGDVLSIIDDEGVEFARGISNYDSQEAGGLLGRDSNEIADADFPEFITRDNIALME